MRLPFFFFYRLIVSGTILQHTPSNFVPKSQLNSTARSCANQLPITKLSCLFRSLLADVASDVGLAVDASVAGAGADLLGLDVVVVSASVLVADGLDTADVDVGERGSVTEVGVDTCDPVSKLSLGLVFCSEYLLLLTSKRLALRGSDVVEDDVALVLGLAVAAAAVELAEVVDSEARNRHGAATVVLEDLVLGAESTAASDSGGVTGSLLLDGESVLADGGPPDVLQLAVAEAVDTLDLVGANDDVGKARALLEDEDGVAVATLSLASAGLATVVDEHAAVEALASSDGLDSVESRGAGRSRDAAAR